MKYKEGNIVLLNNGKTVYILSVNSQTKKYQVCDTEGDNKVFEVSESAINCFLT